MIINKFYAAYAYRKCVSPKDIVGEADTYEKAWDLAVSYLCDDDDEGVFINVDSEWYRVWGRDPHSQALVVSKEYAGWNKAYVSEWY
jgi:hypothetical protein